MSLESVEAGFNRWRDRALEAETEIERLRAEIAFLRGESVEEERRETVEYFLRSRQPDGTLDQASATMDNPDELARRLDMKRAHSPELDLSGAQRVTTVVVRPYPPSVGE